MIKTIQDNSKRNAKLLRRGKILFWRNYAIALAIPDNPKGNAFFEDGGLEGYLDFYGFDKLLHAKLFLRQAKTWHEEFGE